MTQYMLTQKQGIHDLAYCLNKYTPVRLILSAFSLGSRTGMHGKSLDKAELQSLEMIIDSKWQFYTSRGLFAQITPDKNERFKIEYMDKTMRRIHPYYDNPNDERLDNVAYSTFRNVVDDYLLEIFFKGKIPLIPTHSNKKKDARNTQFWKVKKKEEKTRKNNLS